MKIKIELNSKELALLHANKDSDAGNQVAIEYTADVTTESGDITLEQEHLIFGSALWGLLMMLPHGLVKQYFLAWNSVVEDFHSRLQSSINDELSNTHPNLTQD